MIKKIIIFFFTLIFLVGGSKLKVLAQETVNIQINPHQILNEDFTQIKGGYISERYDPNSLIDLSNPSLIDSLKYLISQDADPPTLILTNYYLMYPGSPVLEDNEVKALIRLCKEVNCDPIFSPISGMPPPYSDPNKMRARVQLVKDECQRVFGDNKHCLHWTIGGEPPTTADNCPGWANLIHQAGLIVKDIIPEAKIHALELFEYAAKVRGTDETVGECIIRQLNEKTPKLKIDYLKTHWYPYLGELDIRNRTYTDGNKLLSWEGDSLSPRLRRMLYPYDVVRDMKLWAQKYEVSREAEIGFGEVLPWAAGQEYGGIYQDDDVVKGCCWLKQNYKGDLTLYGGCDPCLYQSKAEIPSTCQNKCRVPGNFPTRRLHLTWGGAFWFLDELGISAEAGIKNIQIHTFVTSLVWPADGKRSVVTEAYNFYNQYFGNTIVQSSSDQPEILNSHASLDKDGNLRVILINKDINNRAKTARISISGYQAQDKGEAYILRVPNADFNSEEPGGPIQTTSNISVGTSFNYLVDGHAAVIIKIPGEVICQWANNTTGDANGDGQINIDDKNQWKTDFAQSLCKNRGCYSADFDHDKKVCLSDLEIWRRSRN
ncbi:MAG: hypothetical protein QHH09_02530 [Microgenomates group bacterium]|nr:hypothetical protein [Microgenomates group bacterium]